LGFRLFRLPRTALWLLRGLLRLSGRPGLIRRGRLGFTPRTLGARLATTTLFPRCGLGITGRSFFFWRGLRAAAHKIDETLAQGFAGRLGGRGRDGFGFGGSGIPFPALVV